MKTDKSLFFVIIAMGCFYFVLDEFFGNRYISQTVVKMIPYTNGGGIGPLEFYSEGKWWNPESWGKRG